MHYSDSATDTVVTTVTKDQAKITSEVHTKPKGNLTSDLQFKNVASNKTTHNIYTNNLHTVISSTSAVCSKPDDSNNDKLQTKLYVTNDSSTTASSNLHVDSHTKTTNDLPVKSVSDCYTETDDDFHVKTKEDFHTTTEQLTLDVVSDHFVGVADTGWGSTHKLTASDEPAWKRLKGTLLLNCCIIPN